MNRQRGSARPGRLLVEKLRSYPWWKHDLLYVILFGSAVKGTSGPGDVDLAVRFGRYTFEKYLDVLEGVSSYLGLSEDLLDLVVLNGEDLPAELLVEIYSGGVLLYAFSRPEKKTRDP